MSFDISLLARILFVVSFAGGCFWVALRRSEAAWVMRALLPITPILILIASILSNFWIFLGLLWAFLPIWTRVRGYAAPAFFVSLLALPSMHRPLAAGGAYFFSTSSYHILALSLLFCPRVTSRRGYGKPLLPSFLLVLGVELFINARNPALSDSARGFVQTFLDYGLPYIAVARTISSAKELRQVLIAISLAAFIQSMLALLQTYSHWPMYEQISSHLGIDNEMSQALKIRGGVMRANGSFPESTSFSWFLAMGLAATLTIRDSFKNTLHWLAVLAVILAGLYVAQSRGGWLAVGLSLIALDVVRRRPKALMLKLVGVAGIVGMSSGAALLMPGFADPIGIASGPSDTVDYRQDLLRRGMEEIAKHPVSGLEISEALDALSDLKQGEHIVDFVNAYVYFGLTAGVFGVIAVIVGHLFGVFCLYRDAGGRKSDPAEQSAMQFGFCAIVVIIISSFTSGFGGDPAAVYFMFLALGSAGIASKRRTVREHDRIAKSEWQTPQVQSGTARRRLRFANSVSNEGTPSAEGISMQPADRDAQAS